jgi:hypothetical protein
MTVAHDLCPLPLRERAAPAVPHTGLGEGYRAAARDPSPALLCGTAAAALSLKGRGHSNKQHYWMNSLVKSSFTGVGFWIKPFAR